jgi:hypothetical protein
MTADLPFSRIPLPEWVEWVAQDPDGSWWGYEHEPLAHDGGWYENEVGRCLKIVEQAPGADWRTSLQRVPRTGD